MPLRVTLNGREVTPARPLDRACQYGDGLFETLAIRGGRPAQFLRHMRRLADGADRLGLPTPDPDDVHEHVLGIATDVQDASLRLTWSAGYSERGYRRPVALVPNLGLELFATAPLPPMPVHVRLCRTRMGSNPQLAGIKHLNRLEQVLARAEWQDEDIFEGLVSDQSGRVVEGTHCNILVQRGDVLSTPRIRDCGVRGTVRELALEMMADAGMQQARGDFFPADLKRADALYLTGSLIGVVRVGSLDGHAYDPDVAEIGLVDHIRRAAFEIDREAAA